MKRTVFNPEAPLDDVHGDFPFSYLPEPQMSAPPRHFYKVAVWMTFFFFVVVFLLAISIGAFAHDHARPDLDTWFRQQYSGKGPCCDGEEAKHVADVDWDTTCADNKCHYRVMLYGKWWNVDDAAVVQGPNRSGTALVWAVPTRRDNDVASVFIRCFMPGAGG